jgi:ribosomal protein S18 acetylase RimI-like enzyme
VEHILDNPIWNALNTGNKNIAAGEKQARFFDRGMAIFAGLEAYSEADFRLLHGLSSPGEAFILFTPGNINIPGGWKTQVEKGILQMVYQQPEPPSAEDQALVALQEKDIPAMLALTGMTNPGPFFSRTIAFGGYHGIFDADRLVAMAGQRLQPGLYTEISAVCTHPDYTGKGFAGQLVRDLVRKIITQSRVPFLHLMRDNTGAYHLYKKTGFETRREMMVYVVERQAS